MHMAKHDVYQMYKSIFIDHTPGWMYKNIGRWEMETNNKYSHKITKPIDGGGVNHQLKVFLTPSLSVFGC